MEGRKQQRSVLSVRVGKVAGGDELWECDRSAERVAGHANAINDDSNAPSSIVNGFLSVKDAQGRRETRRLPAMHRDSEWISAVERRYVRDHVRNLHVA